MMKKTINCFCGMVDQRKAFSLISRKDHCQRSSSLQISDTPQAEFESVQNLNSGLVEWKYALVITTIPWEYKKLLETHHASAITHYPHPGLYVVSRPQSLMLNNSKIMASISKNDFSESAKMKYSIHFLNCLVKLLPIVCRKNWYSFLSKIDATSFSVEKNIIF